jgi:hypothetical protein
VALAVLCVAVSRVAAAPELVQSSVSSNPSVTSFVAELPDAATPGDVVVTAVWWDHNQAIAVFDNLDASCGPATPAFDYGGGLVGQMFVVTVNDAGPFFLTYRLADAGTITPYQAEFSGVPAHVEDQATQIGDASVADSGTVNASAGALLVGWNVVTGGAGDAGSFKIISRFQTDLFAYMVAPDAGPFALTTEEFSEFSLPIAWGSQLISLAAPRPDAGTPDAGTTDAGSPDAGAFDAGPMDAGSGDAGSPDAGSPDAGSTDAGDQLSNDTVHCGCDGAGAGAPVLLGLAAALRRAAARRARASRASRDAAA